MSIQAILTEADYDAALARLTVLLDAANDTSQNEEISALAALIEAYEEKHFPIPPTSFVATTWDELDSEDFSDLANGRAEGVGPLDASFRVLL